MFLDLRAATEVTCKLRTTRAYFRIDCFSHNLVRIFQNESIEKYKMNVS